MNETKEIQLLKDLIRDVNERCFKIEEEVEELKMKMTMKND